MSLIVSLITEFNVINNVVNVRNYKWQCHSVFTNDINDIINDVINDSY